MRNFRLFNLFIGLCVLLLVSSCDKNEIDNQSQAANEVKTRTGNEVLDANTIYFHEGVAKYGSQITELETMNVIIGYNGHNYVFDNDASLRSWTFGNSDRTRTREVLDSINYFKTLENDPNGPTKVEESIIPKGWLYRDLNRQGPSWPIKGWSYGSKNNTASSFLVVLGGAVLCDKKWWGGKKIWLIAVPGNWGNLNIPYNFEDKAESGWDI